MVTASIELTDQELNALRSLEQQTGRTQNELLHEAVVRLLSQLVPDNRLELLQQARGLWKDRTDIPAASELRQEWDNRMLMD